MRTSVILDQGPFLLQYDLILTTYICNDPNSNWGHVHRYHGLRFRYIFLGTQFSRYDYEYQNTSDSHLLPHHLGGLFELGESGVQAISIYADHSCPLQGYSLMEKLMISKSTGKYSLGKMTMCRTWFTKCGQRRPFWGCDIYRDLKDDSEPGMGKIRRRMFQMEGTANILRCERSQHLREKEGKVIDGRWDQRGAGALTWWGVSGLQTCLTATPQLRKAASEMHVYTPAWWKQGSGQWLGFSYRLEAPSQGACLAFWLEQSGWR